MKAPSDLPGRSVQPPTPRTRVLAGAVVAWCLAFATVNIVYEASDHFVRGAYAQDARAFSIINWLVVALKILGAAAALLTGPEPQAHGFSRGSRLRPGEAREPVSPA